MCSDALVYGFNTECGEELGSSGTAIWTLSGPYVLTIKSDADNADMVAGFSINYTLLPC